MKNIKEKIDNFFIYLWKQIDKDDKLTPVQQLAYDIYLISLNDPNNIRYLNSYESNKKYIVSKKYVIDKDVITFIILDENKITIVNHDYKYDIEIPNKTSDKMKKMFYDKVNEDRERMEKEIMCNIKSSLETVLTDFKKKISNNNENG
jgi:hypothetical protein